MKSQTLPQFWKRYDQFSKEVQHRASKTYRM